ncbi:MULTISPECIES: LTA synthase family protein [Bacillaceae]|uniref:LTA synthase family protein n=1 Tax=Bacillaceae TaxID=186817 RepID=UPI001C5757D9|nr:LTA synthase family protein [Rossellomorea sp. YZS02]MBW3113718.1 LTA synthase family protein [Bacillus sp. MCCB 382]MDX8343631.1 LTA synthase family protein [Rossellomorea sp. YZS02]
MSRVKDFLIGLRKNQLLGVAILSLWIKTVVVSLIGFNLQIESFLDLLLIVFNPVGSLMLLIGFSFYFFKRVKPFLLVLIMGIATGLLYGDLLYFRFYSDFITVPILFQFKNVGGIGPSTFELMSPWDVLLLSDLILAGWILKTKKTESVNLSRIWKLNYLGFSMFLLLITLIIGLLKSPYLFAESYDREQLVKSVGPFNYHLYDIGIAATNPLSQLLASKSDTEASIQYTKSSKKKPSDLFGVAEGKNLILVSMESTQNFVINQKVNGEEITPFLNSLIKDSLYFSNIYDQTAQGKTSDAEFMIDTGLYPLSSGSAFVRKPDNTYRSLPHILKEKKDYFAAVFHGNDRTFWNREYMYKALGYDRYFSKRDYNVTEENSVNYGIKDIPFFEQTTSLLEKIPKPFYTRLITLTNHFPFLLEEGDQFIEQADTREDVVNRYVTTVRYEDEAIKALFENLKANGLYDDTVVVLYGDHYGISEKYEQGVFELLGQKDTPVNHAKLQQVPLIIHVPGQEGKTIETIGGEIDIRATVLHLLGIGSKDTLSFGHSLFTRDENHPVIFRDGDFITKEYIFQDNVCYSKKSEKSVSESRCEPFKELVRKELRMSDDILYGDLLRFLE